MSLSLPFIGLKETTDHNTPFTCHGLCISLAYKRPQTIPHSLYVKVCPFHSHKKDHGPQSHSFIAYKRPMTIAQPLPVSVSSFHSLTRDQGP